MNRSHNTSFAICCLLLSTVLFLLVACRPKGVLSVQEMEDLLYELHLTDGVIDQAGLVYGHDEEQRAYYAVTMQKMGITQEEFDSSIVWYTHHPQTFNKIYPKGMKRLEDMNIRLFYSPPRTNWLLKQNRLRSCHRLKM